MDVSFFCSLFCVPFLCSCAPFRPASPRRPPPPPLKISHVLDNKSFAFDVAFLPGDLVGCALMEGGAYRLAVYDRGSGKRLRHVHLGAGQDWLHAMAVAPGGDLLAVGFRSLRKQGDRLVAGGVVALYDLTTGRTLRQHPLPTPVRDLAFVDRQRLVLGTEAQYLRLGRQQKPRPGTAQVCLVSVDRGVQRCVADHGDTVTSVVPLPGGGVASGSWDRTVRLRDSSLAPPGSALRFAGHVNALAVDLLGRLAVATSHRLPRRSRDVVLRERRREHRQNKEAGDTVQLWDLSSKRRQRLWRVRPHQAQVTEVALAPGGDTLASGSWDWTVALFRGLDLAPLRPFSQIITGLEFHAAPSGGPRSRTLAVAAWSEHRSSAPSCLLVKY